MEAVELKIDQLSVDTNSAVRFSELDSIAVLRGLMLFDISFMTSMTSLTMPVTPSTLL